MRGFRVLGLLALVGLIQMFWLTLPAVACPAPSDEIRCGYCITKPIRICIY